MIPHHNKKVLAYSFFSILFFIVAFFNSCHHAGSSGLSADAMKGKELAGKYCQSCLLLPEPFLADKKTWLNGILPNMGPRLGIFNFNDKQYPSSKSDPNIGGIYYPDHQVLSYDEWGQILEYYSEAAPDSLSAQQRKNPIQLNTPLFTAVSPGKHYRNPVSTFLSVDTSVFPHRILQAEGLLKFIYVYDDHLQLKDSFHFKGTVLDIINKKDSMILCNVGVINPNDGRFGSIQEIATAKKAKDAEKPRVLFDSLRRPVQLVEADLNGDNKKDFIVCEFGNLLGALSWLENMGDGTFTRHILRATPGAIKAVVQDYNHDGLPDIWVLFAQGDEGIVLFTNKGHGKFEQQQILRFPAIYGSSHFELVDFNGDGYPDILYTCGDNADYSQIFKPYHGVYIFLNDGHEHFKQTFFYPIHGCYKALAKDFDGDGDLDIATISFFADYAKQPQEGFVYLENKGNWNFEAFSVPQAQSGRWLTMDAGDVDGDGKPDIILGNFSVGPIAGGQAANWKNGPPFLLLKNTGKK